MALSVVTAPATYPVTIPEIKDHLRITGDDLNFTLEQLLAAATELAESFTNRAYIQRTLKQTFDEFEDTMILSFPPLQSVTTVNYTDLDGNSQTLGAGVYTVDTDSDPGRIHRAYNQTWPSVRDIPNAIEITYVCGHTYTSSSPNINDDLTENVPSIVKLAIMALVGFWLETPEANHQNLPDAFRAMLWPERVVPV